MAATVTNTFAPGVNTSFSTELNENFDDALKAAPEFVAVYTGSGYDTSITLSASTSEEASYEFSSLSSDDVNNRDYLVIQVSGTHTLDMDCGAGGNGIASSQFKIQTKEIGGSYSDSLAYVSLHALPCIGDQTDSMNHTSSFSYIHTLSAGEKSNGVQVKVFSKADVTRNTAPTDSMTATFTNIQTSLKLI